MEIRLDQLGDEPYKWDESLTLSRDDLDHPDVVGLSEVTCRGRLTRTTLAHEGSGGQNSGFHLSLDLAYEHTLACTRCLKQLTEPVATRIDMIVFVEDPGAAEEMERELAEEDLGVLQIAHPLLDTSPLLVEQVELAVPMRALCREDCAGLCPECGADRNAGACDCEAPVDSRWAALAKLKS